VHKYKTLLASVKRPMRAF